MTNVSKIRVELDSMERKLVRELVKKDPTYAELEPYMVVHLLLKESLINKRKTLGKQTNGAITQPGYTFLYEIEAIYYRIISKFSKIFSNFS